MKDKRSLHLKVQELCDCYATADPLREMSLLGKDADIEEAALKWLALAAVHGVNHNAKSIKLARAGDGSVRVIAKYRKSELPSPGAEIGARAIEAMRAILHAEGEDEEIPLALGIRDNSLTLNVEVEKDEDEETLTLKFPQ
jgi:hypothetical protein